MLEGQGSVRSGVGCSPKLAASCGQTALGPTRQRELDLGAKSGGAVDCKGRAQKSDYLGFQKTCNFLVYGHEKNATDCSLVVPVSKLGALNAFLPQPLHCKATSPIQFNPLSERVDGIAVHARFPR